jgi:Tfp pilus assembly protein PilX
MWIVAVLIGLVVGLFALSALAAFVLSGQISEEEREEER